MWPPGSHLSSYEKALGWPAQQAGPTDPGILDHIEGVQATLAADKEAAALLPRWETAIGALNSCSRAGCGCCQRTQTRYLAVLGTWL
ncbi:hypothetical protein HaLaN_31893 [Haematococcus lacustris]|uniref:Uncharacterized protein n=1 Tax=Haematococcus lacustris TaxID=44745 RepID=A0A6A0AIT2_HAELA|nr:hypothetical protein HaLaN_31893 [Haematococcus lacustris]